MQRLLRRSVYTAIGIWSCASGFTIAAAPASQENPSLFAQTADGANRQPGESGEQAIRQALGSKTNLDLVDVPLKLAVEYIAGKHHIPIHLDAAALKEAGIDPAKNLVTISVKDISLRSALDLILSQLNLTSVMKDEVLLVTTADKASTMLETRLYNVRDLVEVSGGTDLEELADALRQTVNPSSWDKAGGNGSLAPFNAGGVSALIVVQTRDGQDQIENLLSELRKLKPQRAIRQ